MHYLYILYSFIIGKFYIGITTNIEKRIYYHNNNRSPFTKIGGHGCLSIQRYTRQGREPY
jgi:predicted GIY-YIG superfamily endonuclease